MLKLIQYLKGYVIIKVWGFSPERFMNLCSNHQLFLWDIANFGEYYTMCISIKDFYKLKTITRKTGTRVVIQKRCGLPFFVPKLKKRKVFVLGLLGSIVFWIWMSGYIWAIELQGNYYVTNDELMAFVAEMNIEVGSKTSKVDIEALEKSLRSEYDIITWTSARIDGTRLVIQIKENELTETQPTEPTLQEGAGYDLVAEKDGTVVSIITRSGVPLVTEGSEVMAGDILVQGGVPLYNDDTTIRNYQYCVADADIYIRTRYQGTETLPVWYDEKQYSGEEKQSPFIELFGKRFAIKLYRQPYETYDTTLDMHQLRLLENFYLPISYGTERVREYTLVTQQYTKEEAKAIFTERTVKIIETLMEKGVQIIQKNVTMKKDSFNWYLDINFDIIEKAGKITPTTLTIAGEADPATGAPASQDPTAQAPPAQDPITD
ncbi:MAG: sporulation protein YqfD [Lachnospiraceae bacterium]|jgi:similar to stage IV sporulation protein|nr:sporulation protein YqfD [Lachnospiraceae bacterium]